MSRNQRANWLLRILTALALYVAFSHSASAHPISVVVETAYIEPDAVYLDVEIFAEDLFFYHQLKKNKAGEVPAADLRAAALAHGPLLLERLLVYDASGEAITGGRVVSIEGNDFQEDIAVGQLMGYDVRYRLELPLSSPPEFLSFSQRLVDDDAGFPALVDLRIKQAGHKEEVTATLKPGHVRTVRLRWDDGAAQSNDADREAWMLSQRDDALSAGALNRVRSFLYINRREVRHELLMPFPLLESYITIDRARPNEITAGEQEAAREKIIQFFRQKNPITIDGQRREPSSARVEFFTLDELDRTQAPRPRTVSTINSRVGIMLTYPTETPAKNLELLWNAFNRQAWQVDAFCFVEDQVLHPEFSMATRQQRFEWERPVPPEPIVPTVAAAPRPAILAVPWLALMVAGSGFGLGWWFWGRAALVGACVAVGITLASTIWPGPSLYVVWPWQSAEPISTSEANSIVATLHENLYLACAASTNEAALRAIGAATDGELERRMYLQLVEAIGDPGELGLRPAAGEVEITSGELTEAMTEDGGFNYACEWKSTGRVEHWGHVHTRRYGYEAILHVAPRNGQWLITKLDLRRVRLLKDRAVGVF